MKTVRFALVLVASLLLAACENEQQAEMPPPFSLTAEAMGRYCGMNVLEHAGPKGQIILRQIPEAIWFSSARDTVAFTMLPDEPKEIAAIYVSDMGRAPSWDKPGAENWVDARKAIFVIGSARRGGMGAEEAVPFSEEAAARDFASSNGGEVVKFDDLPESYILGEGGEGSEAADDAPAGGAHDHG